MTDFLLRRLVSVFFVLLGVVVLVSLAIHVVPGDPVDRILGPFATHTEKVKLRTDLGLDQPIYEQIKSYLVNILQGNLGHSLIYNRPVLDLISERVIPTVELAILSILLAIFLSLPLGVLSALFPKTFIDYFSMLVALLGVSIPNFWLGPLLILFFSVHLDLFPVSERNGLLSYVLPCITLGTALQAVLTRMTRTTVMENLKEDFVQVARSKGLIRVTIIFKHVLRVAAIPIITMVGLQFGVLLTGSIITEKIFDWPGLGTLILDGIQNRDYPLVQGCVLIFSMVYILVNLITDLTYVLIDPRVKMKG